MQDVGGLISSPVSYRDRALRSLGELPPFSPILNKLQATLADENVSFAKIAELIEKDTVLAGNVLRLVNSALYGHRGTINSVSHAVSLIGVVKLRNTAMTLSVSRMWNSAKTPKGWSSVKFNLHAVATAIMSDSLAQRVPVVYPEGAFVAGLLHNIGLLLIAISLPAEYEEIRRLHQSNSHSLAECEKEVLGLDHAEISAAVLAEWNLPEPIQKAVRYSLDPQRQTSEDFPLSRIIQVAELVVNLQGITIFESSHATEDTVEEILDQLGLGAAAAEITDEFTREYKSISNFF